MNIKPIKENMRDYMAAGALGVIGGYTIKNSLPLSEYEKTEFFTPDVMRSLKKVEKLARTEEYDAILVGAKKGSEEVAGDILDIFKANKENIVGNKFSELLENIKSYDKNAQEAVIKLSNRVRVSGKDARKIEANKIESLAKGSRPTAYFVIITLAALMSLAVLKNSLSKNMDETNEHKQLDKVV